MTEKMTEDIYIRDIQNLARQEAALNAELQADNANLSEVQRSYQEKLNKRNDIRKQLNNVTRNLSNYYMQEVYDG